MFGDGNVAYRLNHYPRWGVGSCSGYGGERSECLSPCTLLEDLEEASGPWLWNSLVRAILASSEMNQGVEDLFLCLPPTFLCNSQVNKSLKWNSVLQKLHLQQFWVTMVFHFLICSFLVFQIMAPHIKENMQYLLFICLGSSLP